MATPLRVLIVEDSLTDIELLLHELRKSGYDPVYTVVESAAEMEAALAEQPWDVIVSDYVLRNFDALAALRLVHEKGRDTPLIIVSDSAGEETAVEAMRAGASDYVTKGNLARLIPAIQRELRDAEMRQHRHRAEEERDGLLSQLQKAQEELRLANLQLEMRVKERTAELERANAELHKEIAERKRVEHELRKLWRAVEQSSNTIVITDTNGVIEYVNPRFIRLTGYSAEEAIGQNPRLLKSGQMPPEFYQELWRTISAGQEWRGEFLNRKKNGELYWEAASISPVRDAEGRITHFLAVKEDITERKRYEEERERLLAQLRQVNEELSLISLQAREQAEKAEQRAAELDATISSIADGVVIYDRAGRIIHLNRTAADILGYTAADPDIPPSEQPTLSHIETANGQKPRFDDTPSTRALRGETVRGVVSVLHQPSGKTIHLSSSAAPIRTASGKIIGAVATFTDITALHELQEQREDFIRAISHDLRNPLANVLGQAQMLQRYAAKPEIAQQAAASIYTSARRINAMIQDLVDVVRLEAGQMRLDKQPTSLICVVTDLLDRSSASLDTERIKADIPADLPPALIDPDKFERILLNLLTNALKYSYPQTEIIVRASAAGDEAIVSVSDCGPGIAADDLPHIFDRFYRAKGSAAAEGSGLGLYIARMLVEAHGGRIWAESEPGRGSSFCFTIPLA